MFSLAHGELGQHFETSCGAKLGHLAEIANKHAVKLGWGSLHSLRRLKVIVLAGVLVAIFFFVFIVSIFCR